VRRSLRVFGIVFAAIVVIALLLVAVPGPRSWTVRVALQIVLAQRGYHLATGSFTAGKNELDAAGISITDRTGVPLFTAKRVIIYYDARGLYGRSDRAYGIHAIVVTAPVVSIVRHTDGTFNFTPLLKGWGAPTSAAGRPPYHFTFELRGGRMTFASPSAFAPPGRRFAVNAVTADADISQGALSKAMITGSFNVHGDERTAGETPMRATLYENDQLSYALAKLSASHLAFAPIVDGLVSTPNFAVEAGTADVTLSAFDAGYDRATGPQWRASGVAPVQGGQIRFLPLDVPLRDLAGTLHFDGGILSVSDVNGDAANIPVALNGGIRILDGVRFAVGATLEADLVHMRRLLAFSTPLPLTGDLAAFVHVDGPSGGLHVRGIFHAPGTVTYQDFAFGGPAGDFFYADGHVTLSRVAMEYAGGDAYGGGDIDVWSPDRSSAFELTGSVPALSVPVIANVNPDGTASAIVSLSGPLTRLSGQGYAQVMGGDGVEVRTTVAAGPQRLSIGPLVARGAGGTLTVAASIDRQTKGPRAISGDLIAEDATIHLRSGAYTLPGSGASIGLPSVDGTFDGAAWLQGTESLPVVGVDLQVSDLVVSGERLGTARAIALGNGRQIRVGELSVNGADANVTASGFAAAQPSSGRYAAALEGSGAVELATLPGLPPSLKARGRSSGRFSAFLGGGRWTVSGDASSADATVSGVAVRTLGATISGGGGKPTQVYAATATAAGGEVAATGMLPRAGGPPDALSVWARNIDMRALHPLGMPLQTGSAVALARIGGSPASPTADGVASLSGGQYRSTAVSGDMDVHYANGLLVAQSGRVAFAGNRASVSGSVGGVAPGSTLRNAALNIRAIMRVGDLGGLLDPYIPTQATLAGLVAGDLRVSGSVASPRLDGVIDSPGGTIRGVAFNDMHGVVHVAHGALSLSDGEVRLGSSQLTVAGSLTQRSVRVRSSSPHIDLSDFNDFFNGYDTIDGVGKWNVAFQSTPAGVAANGSLDLDGAALVGYPLGTIDATFSNRGDALLAALHQRGPADSADLSGSVTLPRRANGVPDLSHAYYDIRGNATGVDLGVVMPLIRHEDIGLTGRLNIAGSLRGELDRPSTVATFDLHDGHIGKLPITALSGALDSDGKSFGVTDAHIDLPFAQAVGSAQFGPGDRLVGSAGIDAQDLAKLGTALGRPGILEGAAKASVSVAGTFASPRVQASIQGGKGALLGVGFDSANAKINYEPGEADISDAAFVLAGNRGTVSLTGVLPLRLQPLSLGPKDRPIDLHLVAQNVDLSAFSSLTAKFGRLGGILQGTASAVGKAGDPVLAGSASLRGGTIVSQFETVPLERVDADMSLAQDTVTLSRFRGSLGSGDVVAHGTAHVVPAVGLRSTAGLQYSARVALNSATVDVPGWIGGTFNGNFSLTKSGINPYLEGSITATNALIPFSAIYQLASGFGQGGSPPAAPGPVPGVPAPLPGRTVAYAGSIYGGNFHLVSSVPIATATPSGFVLPPVDLNVTATAGKLVRVKGGAIDLTAAGAVVVGGNLRAPTLDGSFSSTRGQVTYFDTVFRIDRGTVEFSHVTGLLPSLDVSATTNTSGTQITLAITGRVDRLNTDLSSVPSMTRDEIAATLLHAPQVTSLTNSTPAQAQAILTGEAQAYFNAQLTRSLLFPLESFLAESLNIEQINFIFDQHGQAAIEIRKLFTPTIYGIYQSTVSLPVTQSFGVAYVLRDTASLELLQTQTPTGVSDATLALRFSFH
jgi:translocation-and-assembly-module (TAM) inner membrane subunit TamB-like protein